MRIVHALGIVKGMVNVHNAKSITIAMERGQVVASKKEAKI